MHIIKYAGSTIYLLMVLSRCPLVGGCRGARLEGRPHRSRKVARKGSLDGLGRRAQQWRLAKACLHKGLGQRHPVSDETRIRGAGATAMGLVLRPANGTRTARSKASAYKSL